MRFFFSSLLAHALLLAATYFLLRPSALETPPLQLSKGEVFVGKSPLVSETKAPSPAPVTSATEVAAPVGGISLGTPDGEAKPREGITLAYPPLSVRLGEEGAVTVSFDISESGSASNAKVLKSSGFARLDQAAVEALSKVHYSSVPSHKEITVEFRLKNAGVEIK